VGSGRWKKKDLRPGDRILPNGKRKKTAVGDAVDKLCRRGTISERGGGCSILGGGRGSPISPKKPIGLMRREIRCRRVISSKLNG